MRNTDIKRLFNTTAVRLSLTYALLYVLFAGSALGAFHWATSRYVDSQLSAGLREEFQGLLGRLEIDGLDSLAAWVNSHARVGAADGRYYLLVDTDRRKLAGNLSGWPEEADDETLVLDGKVHNVWLDDDVVPQAAADQDMFWPTIATVLPDGSVLVVARSVQDAEQLRLFSLYALLGLLAIIVLLALVAGLYLGRNILARIDGLAATADSIMAGDLAQRMPLSDRDDEFDGLALRLNAMLERINQLLRGMREVTDNVAHDLRSPLTRLRNRLEVALLEHREAGEYQDVMEKAVDDIDGVMKTFNAILHIAQAQAGTLRASMDTVDLAHLATEVGELYAALAEQRQQRLIIDAAQPARVLGNRDLLAQALSNLLDNAIKYSPPGGRILVTVECHGPRVRLGVSDNGPGIPAGDRERVTERFVRLDPARSCAGNGLGLSMVKAIAAQHGALLELRDNAPGLLVEIDFPVTSQG